MSTGFSRNRRMLVGTFAGSKGDATAKADLAASYAKVGSAINISGALDPILHLRELANAENAVVKVFLAHTGSAPSSSTDMYQLVGTNGAEIEVTVPQNLRRAFPLAGVSGKYILLEGKGASSTTADLSAFMPSNYLFDNIAGGDSRFLGYSHAIAATATNLSGSYADIGSAVRISGFSHLTLYVYNSGDQTADIQIYTSFGSSAPAATTNMYPWAVAAGTLVTLSTLTTERAAHPLVGVSGDYLMISAKTTGSGTASITAYLYGTPAGV